MVMLEFGAGRLLLFIIIYWLFTIAGIHVFVEADIQIVHQLKELILQIMSFTIGEAIPAMEVKEAIIT